MGEEVGGVPEAAPVGVGDAAADAAGSEGSIGRYLARQRQLRDISVHELASLTKIPIRSLERLESGAFDAAPDGFARGFVRTVAEALGLDPDDAVMRLMQEPPEEEPPVGGLARARGPLLGALLLLGVGLLAVLLWRLVAGWLAPDAGPVQSDLILRQDPVRSLAREQASRARAAGPDDPGAGALEADASAPELPPPLEPAP